MLSFFNTSSLKLDLKSDFLVKIKDWNRDWKNLRNEKSKSKLIMISIDMIISGENQFRDQSRDDDLNNLVQSIKDYGVICPIKVRKLENDIFEIVSGHRRFWAAKMAKLKKIPAVVIDECDTKSLLLFLAENLNCKKLNCFQEAQAIFKLIDECHFTQKMICDSLGLAQSFVADRLKLLKIKPCVREKIVLKNLDIEYALLFAMIDQESKQIEIIEEIINKNLDIFQTRNLVFEYLHNLDINNLDMKKENQREIKPKESNGTSKKNNDKSKNETIYLVKDVRFFDNTVLQVIKMMNKSGLMAVSEKHETNDFFEYTIKIPKEKDYSKCRDIKNIKKISGF